MKFQLTTGSGEQTPRIPPREFSLQGRIKALNGTEVYGHEDTTTLPELKIPWTWLD